MDYALGVALLPIAGACAGFLAGLLGIGGGIVLVPALYYLLSHYGFDAHAMHIAVGTSLSTIIFTGASSARAHYKRGALDITLWRKFLPGVFIGAALASIIAGHVDTVILKAFFAISQIIFGSYIILFGNKAAPFSAMPKEPFLTLCSCATACLAVLKGVGGGVQNVLFMTLCSIPIHRAVATASAIGPFIAALGTLGFIFIGQNIQGLPPYSLGYINLAALACIIPASILCAPIGAAAAHAIPVKKLKRGFSIFMIFIAIKMISEIILK